MKNPLVHKYALRKNKRQCLTGVALVAILAGCGGGESHAASIQLSTPLPPSLPSKAPSLPAKSPSLPPKSPTLPPAYPANPGSVKNQLNCATDAVTCVEVASTGSQTQASLPVTFGQPFKAGDWQYSTQDLVAKVDGNPVPLQTDEISSHRDGSARFAVLSAQLANVPPGQKRIVNLYTAQKSSAPSATSAEPDWNLELEVQLYDANNNVVGTLVASPQAQLKTQIAQKTGQRLKGPVATEYTVVTGFKNQATGQDHPHLSARLHTRLYDNGQRIRTDVVLENTRTWTAGPGNLTYDLAIKRHGTVVHKQPRFTHYHHARWHKVVWTGGAEPAQRLRYNMPYFLATRATWNYDLGLTVPESVLSSEFTKLTKARQEQEALGPMGNVFVTPAFGTTGGRADIGPLPRWTAYYLISQDERAREIMLANADAAGSVPIHYRDEGTNQPVDVEKYPTVTVSFGTSKPLLPVVKDKTIWAPDSAHQASFAYIPYLVTGDAFYLDEVMFWAAWNIASINPAYRDNSAGLIRSSQVRAQAWSLRSIGEAVRALPDSHPMKKYFDKRLTNNLSAFANHTDESPMAIIHHHGDVNRIHPWQNDYVSIVLSLLAENNEPRALEALKWFSKFTVGRFLNESNGFCTARAPGGGWIYRDNAGKYITSWKELYATNYPADLGTPCSALAITEGYPRSAGGYAASARAVLAATSNAGIPEAKSAYLQWKSMTPEMDTKLPSDPTWAIVPRF